MKHAILKGTFGGALLGIVVPLMLLAIQHFFVSELVAKDFSYQFHRVMRIIWPSSTWLMATGGIEGTTRDLMFVIAAVFANSVLYSALGGVLCSVGYLISKERLAH